MPRLIEPMHPNTYYEDEDQVQFVVTIRRRPLPEFRLTALNRGPCTIPIDGPSLRRELDKEPRHREHPGWSPGMATQVGYIRQTIITASDNAAMNVALSGRIGP